MAKAVKIKNQLSNKRISVQARIICVGEKLVVETLMNRSPSIFLPHEEEFIFCRHYTKTKR